MNWLARKLTVVFAIIAIIIITIISAMSQFSLSTIFIRVVVGALVFGLIGGILGEIIYRNVDITVSENYDVVKENKTKEQNSESNSQAKKSQTNKNSSDMEPLQFEEVNGQDADVVNNLDGEQGAELVREMSQEN
ncbi:MAG: hypothetical protein ACQERJ_01305 [Bacillota bacterium]